MNKILALVLCCALCLTFLTGCDPEKTPYVPTGDGLLENQTKPSTTAPPQVEQEMALTYYPERSLNPYTASDFTNRVLFSLLYQGLFQTDGSYRVEPVLCSGYTRSKDMKTYTFYVENATFSDGSALTAEDVAASLQYARESAIYKGRFTLVTGISVSEDGGVVIKLETPSENLPILLDVPIVKADQVAAEKPLGTGPYYWEETGSSVCLLRRNDWWCSPEMVVTASMISLVKATSTSQIRDEFEFGRVDLVCADPGSDLYADYRCDYELWDCENGIFLYLGCNEGSTVFSVEAVRSALTHAIDRKLLVDTYYRGFAREAMLPASPDSPYYDVPLASQYGYEPMKFLQAVENAGLQGAEIKILVNKADSRRVRAARAIAQMLTDCGLKAKTSELTGTQYTNALAWRSYDLHLGQTKLSPNMDLSAFFSVRGALNYGGMSDAAIHALCREALANRGNYYTLHQMVMEDAMLCPILFRSYAVYATRGLLTDLEPARDHIFYYSLGKSMEDVWIQ